VRKAAGNYGISMKEILQAPVSPVIEQQGKLQAAPWVNLVCSGMFCILFYSISFYYLIYIILFYYSLFYILLLLIIYYSDDLF
jgi:hypothetical protein